MPNDFWKKHSIKGDTTSKKKSVASLDTVLVKEQINNEKNNAAYFRKQQHEEKMKSGKHHFTGGILSNKASKIAESKAIRHEGKVKSYEAQLEGARKGLRPAHAGKKTKDEK